MVPTILVIDNYDSFTYNLVQQMRRLVAHSAILSDCLVQVFRNDAITPRAAQQLRPLALIISPGPGTYLDTGVSSELLSLFTDEIPILGVCLGHQLIAHHFGAKIIRGQIPCHGKTTPLLESKGRLFSGVPRGSALARYHSLVVSRESIQAPLLVSALTDEQVVMGVEHRNLPIFGLQFHPESFMTVHGDIIANNFLNTIVRA